MPIKSSGYNIFVFFANLNGFHKEEAKRQWYYSPAGFIVVIKRSSGTLNSSIEA